MEAARPTRSYPTLVTSEGHVQGKGSVWATADRGLSPVSALRSPVRPAAPDRRTGHTESDGESRRETESELRNHVASPGRTHKLEAVMYRCSACMMKSTRTRVDVAHV